MLTSYQTKSIETLCIVHSDTKLLQHWTESRKPWLSACNAL